MKKKPTVFQSFVPLITIALFLGVGYGIFRLNAEILLIGAAFVSGIIVKHLGYSYKEMEEGIITSISKGLPAMMIVIIVGTLIGSWIAAGTIPMLIYYGLKIISPVYYLITACVVCSIVSVVTGISYGTAGTVGVALIGVAHGLNIPLPQAAGAIVAGSYFGDKLSPFSDTTNLAPIAAKSNLFDHIKHMLWTTTPAWLIGLVIYFIIGGGEKAAKPEEINQIFTTLRENFNFNVLLLLPAVMVFYFAIKKKPTIPGMLISAFTATVLGLIFQDISLQDSIAAMVSGFESETGIKVIDTLLSRGGMLDMMHPTLIALCAFSFAGIIQKGGMLDVILNQLMKFARTTGRLIAATVFSCITTAVMTGSSFLSILIPGELFAPAYKKMNLAAKNLSRTTEDSGTVIMPLIPWSIAGVYMAGTLKVPTILYFKWAFMCYLGFVFALIYGFTGFAIAEKIRDDETTPGS